MVPQFLKHGWSAWCSLFLAVFCGAAPGCQALGERKKPQVEDAPKAEKPFEWMENLRPAGPKGQQTGLDPRAQEIERHVGVR